MFYDRAKIYVKGGDGGSGAATFRREKYIPRGGPDGGDGGRGGHVYFRVDPHLNTLIAFRYQQHFRADAGEAGRRSNKTGKQGEDLYIDVPPGTVVYDDEAGEVVADLIEDGDVFLVAPGGKGGLGNTHFKTATRQAPRIAERGEPGYERWVRLELKVIADVGLVGFPNAGKSTLLSVVSAAKPKIADYPFTTLEPGLGVVSVGGRGGESFVMADIPGLIEGAAEGVGLGHEFLRHIERTRLLLHVIDGSGGLEGRDPVADYHAIDAELEEYSEILAAKQQVVAVNKIDLPETRENLERIRAVVEADGRPFFAISGVTGEGTAELLQSIAQLLRDLPPVERAVPADHVLYTLPHRDDDKWEATRISQHHYQVSGAKIERLIKMTDFENEEAADRFQRVLEASGISERLDELGVEPGDIVHIADLELVWDEEALEAERSEMERERRRKTRRDRMEAARGRNDEW
jgi:GTPase